MKSFHSRGFTLVETLIAMAIMAGAIMVVANSWSGSFSRVEKMRAQFRAAGLLQRVMTETKLKYQDAPSALPEEEAGEFPGLQNYKWEIKSRAFDMPSLSSLILAQGGNSKNQDSQFISMVDQMTEFFSKAVKEVTVIVVYKKRGRELRFSASTYFIDYTKQLPMLQAMSAMSGGGAPGGAAGTGPGNVGGAGSTGGGVAAPPTGGGAPPVRPGP